jgi:predicted acyltransferase
MTLIPFPGRGEGSWLLGSNLAQYIDNLLLKNHMWTPDFDPEGFLSTIPAIAQTVLGYQVGMWIRSDREPLEKCSRLFLAANLLLVAGIIWNLWLPINKQLWTSSYVLYTTGFAVHFLAAAYYIIDIKKITWFARPFLVVGSNAIFAYVGSSMLAKTLGKITVGPEGMSIKGFIVSKLLLPVFGNYPGSLIYALLYVALWVGLLAILYKKKIHIKI